MTLTITGRVQGVAYRYWMREAARARGLTGWVRNNATGSVSAYLERPRAQVLAMVEACHAGPEAAEVAHVGSRTVPPSGEHEDFRITL